LLFARKALQFKQQVLPGGKVFRRGLLKPLKNQSKKLAHGLPWTRLVTAKPDISLSHQGRALIPSVN
jgi:hypothetical protein